MTFGTTRACAMVVGLLVAVVAGCGTAGAPASGPGTDEPAAAPTAGEFARWFGGVRIGVRIRFDEDVHVAAARLRYGSQSQAIGIYPLNGADPEPPPPSIDVGAGDEVLLEGDVAVRCDGARPPTPSFEVRTTGGQHTDRERFVTDNLDDLERTIATWCAQPPAVASRGVRSYPDGRYEVRLEFSNPGPAAARVVLEPSTGANGTWRGARTTAAPGEVTRLSVTGRGPVDCDIDPPWADDHLLVDGRPVRPDGEEWCG